MFAISQCKGFQMKFANGWTVSVQFGPGNYCEHHSDDIAAVIDAHKPTERRYTSQDAEIAAWDKNGVWFDFGFDTVKGYFGFDTVKGYCSTDEVADFITMIAKKRE